MHPCPRFARQAMVIDDDDVSRYLLGGLFPGNFEVSELSDGDKAVAAVGRLKPDIAFLNIHLGSGKGAEIIRLLKADGTSAQIPLVAYAARPIRESLSAACAQADALLMLSADAKTSSAAMRQILTKFHFSIANREV